MAVSGRDQLRLLGAAARRGVAAARMEGAAGRRIDRVRDLALDRLARAPGRDRGRAPRRAACACRDAAARGTGPRAAADLDQAAEIHHADAVRHVAHHREIVADEQVGEAEPVLQVAHQVEDLRLHRHVERRGRLVADDEVRPCRRARARSRCAGAGRRRTRAGISRRRPDRGRRASSSSPTWRRCPPARLRDAEGADRLGDDVARAPARIEAGIGVLEHHLDAAAQLPALARPASDRSSIRRR